MQEAQKYPASDAGTFKIAPVAGNAAERRHAIGRTDL
jgi:hypothetical protein